MNKKHIMALSKGYSEAKNQFTPLSNLISYGNMYEAFLFIYYEAVTN